ncbi:MAG TPA: hypothetical protein PL029_07870 [Bacteroidia bacterium]|nr:hypothetical protein [Bacteroidia bacterium]
MELIENYKGKYSIPFDENKQNTFDVRKNSLKAVSRFDVVKVKITDVEPTEKEKSGLAETPIQLTVKFKNAEGAYIGFDAVVFENIEGEAWASYTSIADCHKEVNKIHAESIEVISDVKCTYEFKLLQAEEAA